MRYSYIQGLLVEDKEHMQWENALSLKLKGTHLPLNIEVDLLYKKEKQTSKIT